MERVMKFLALFTVAILVAGFAVASPSQVSVVSQTEAKAITGSATDCGNTLSQGFQACGYTSCGQCSETPVYVTDGDGDDEINHQAWTCNSCTTTAAACSTQFVPNLKVPATCN